MSNREGDYRELSRNGLLKVDWADNIAYRVAIADDGWNYFEGWFLDQEVPVNINVSPVINNNVSNNPNISSSSSSSSTSSSTMNSTLAIQMVLELELNEEDRNVALGAIADLDKSSKGDDKKDFLEKVEKLSAIAKNVVPLASIVIPLIEVAIKQFLGI